MNLPRVQTRRRELNFGENLQVGQLSEVATELYELRKRPPVVTIGDGRREGDILGFVRGLRLSARLTYFLREALSDTTLEVNWAHLLNDDNNSCSPECDVVVHEHGHIKKWNGGGDRPIMDFRFLKATSAKAVVSCKSVLTSVDKEYPKVLKRFGVKKVFLFAECCEESRLKNLTNSAKAAGYSGLCCLYVNSAGPIPAAKADQLAYLRFVKDLRKAVKAPK